MLDRVAIRLSTSTLPGTAVDAAHGDASKVIAQRAFAQFQLAPDGARLDWPFAANDRASVSRTSGF
jgi:hypothetical protein